MRIKRLLKCRNVNSAVNCCKLFRVESRVSSVLKNVGRSGGIHILKKYIEKLYTILSVPDAAEHSRHTEIKAEGSAATAVISMHDLDAVVIMNDNKWNNEFSDRFRR